MWFDSRKKIFHCTQKNLYIFVYKSMKQTSRHPEVPFKLRYLIIIIIWETIEKKYNKLF